MPAIAPPERPEDELVVDEDVCAGAGAEVFDAVGAADVGDEEEAVALAVVEATSATPKAKPS